MFKVFKEKGVVLSDDNELPLRSVHMNQENSDERLDNQLSQYHYCKIGEINSNLEFVEKNFFYGASVKLLLYPYFQKYSPASFSKLTGIHP